ncbi:hypothetical protein Q4Q35_05425 [Flavivirga aquimarina]|uniref:Uncharacterized protein n=1 Tax=Flavivirga aquimarina TaxID=2027862 RepID=A0ABT8W7Y7_9FLAO|nr:hypothetical protein [Flavivirga aquimarina]MDO5969242.1 hypothetical protein [Flavivirga aquimarina]
MKTSYLKTVLFLFLSIIAAQGNVYAQEDSDDDWDDDPFEGDSGYSSDGFHSQLSYTAGGGGGFVSESISNGYTIAYTEYLTGNSGNMTTGYSGAGLVFHVINVEGTNNEDLNSFSYVIDQPSDDSPYVNSENSNGNTSTNSNVGNNTTGNEDGSTPNPDLNLKVKNDGSVVIKVINLKLKHGKSKQFTVKVPYSLPVVKNLVGKLPDLQIPGIDIGNYELSGLAMVDGIAAYTVLTITADFPDYMSDDTIMTSVQIPIEGNGNSSVPDSNTSPDEDEEDVIVAEYTVEAPGDEEENQNNSTDDDTPLSPLADSATITKNTIVDNKRVVILKANGLIFNTTSYGMYLNIEVPEAWSPHSVREVGHIMKEGVGKIGTYVLGHFYNNWNGDINTIGQKTVTPGTFNSIRIRLDVDGFDGIENLEINISKDYQEQLEKQVLPPLYGYDTDIEVVRICDEFPLEAGRRFTKSVEITLPYYLNPETGGEGPSGIIYDDCGSVKAIYNFLDPINNGDGTRTYEEVEVIAYTDIPEGGCIEFEVEYIVEANDETDYHRFSLPHDRDYDITAGCEKAPCSEDALENCSDLILQAIALQNTPPPLMASREVIINYEKEFVAVIEQLGGETNQIVSTVYGNASANDVLELESHSEILKNIQSTLDISAPYDFNIGSITDAEGLRQVTEDTVETAAIDALPENQEVADQEMDFGDYLTIAEPFLVEALIAFLPGSDIIELVRSINNGDKLGVALAIAGLVATAVGGSAIKGALKSIKIFNKITQITRKLGTAAKAAAKAAKKGFETTMDNAGRLILKRGDDVVTVGDDLVKKFHEILGIPKGSRPNPNTYLDPQYISNHLAKFDDGAVRFTKQSNIDTYGTLGPNDAFTMPKSEYDNLIAETGGDLAQIETKLGLNPGDLTGDDAVIAWIEKNDFGEVKIPSGNESGVIDEFWQPGGITSGGVPEGIIDLSDPNLPYTKL